MLAGSRPQPDEAVALRRREAHQTRVADRNAGEVLAARQPPQHAATVVDPAMIGTRERLADAAGALEQAGAAVPAGIEQSVHRAIVVAHQQHRHAGDVERQIVAGPGDLAPEGGEQWMAAEQRGVLRRERRGAR